MCHSPYSCICTGARHLPAGSGAPIERYSQESAVINYRNIKVYLDGKLLDLRNANGEVVEPFILKSNSSVYLPIRAIGDALGLTIGWDAATSTATLTEPKEYPYLDDAGYWHYQVKVNGEVLSLEHDAVVPTKDNWSKEVLYPLTDILDYYGVAYNWEADNDFSTVIGTVRTSFDAGVVWGSGSTTEPIMRWNYDTERYEDPDDNPYVPPQESVDPAPGEGTPCLNCGGTGMVRCNSCGGMGVVGGWSVCTFCMGTGRYPCVVCVGDGIV